MFWAKGKEDGEAEEKTGNQLDKYVLPVYDVLLKVLQPHPTPPFLFFNISAIFSAPQKRLSELGLTASSRARSNTQLSLHHHQHHLQRRLTRGPAESAEISPMGWWKQAPTNLCFSMGEEGERREQSDGVRRRWRLCTLCAPLHDVCSLRQSHCY